MDLNNVKFSWLDGYPKNWEKKRVKYVFYLSKSNVVSLKEYPILSLTMKGIKLRDVSTNEGQLPENYDGYTLLEKDDIVFNPMDLISGWVDKSNVQGLISPSYKVLRTKKENSNRDYFKYFFQTHYTEKIFFPFGEGVHYQYRWGLGSQTLLNFPLLVPPYKEQNQIVQFLDEKTELIDKLISTKEQKITLLKEQKNSLINEVVTKGLNTNVKMKDSGVEWIGEIPINWNMYRVSNFGRFFKGSGIKKDEVKPEGIPCIRYGEIYTKYERVVYNPLSFIDIETSKNSIQIQKGDILFTGSGETIDDIGKSLLYYGDRNIFVGGDIIVLRPKEGISVLYLSYLMNTSFIKHQKSLMGRGEIIVHIYSKNIKEIKTPLPSMEEQLQIVEYLDLKTKEIDDLVELEQKKIHLLKEYRKSLISEVVFGKIKVTTDE